LQSDPIGLGPDVNPYRDEGNNPTNVVDPSGLQPPAPQANGPAGAVPITPPANAFFLPPLTGPYGGRTSFGTDLTSYLPTDLSQIPAYLRAPAWRRLGQARMYSYTDSAPVSSLLPGMYDHFTTLSQSNVDGGPVSTRGNYLFGPSENNLWGSANFGYGPSRPDQYANIAVSLWDNRFSTQCGVGPQGPYVNQFTRGLFGTTFVGYQRNDTVFGASTQFDLSRYNFGTFDLYGGSSESRGRFGPVGGFLWQGSPQFRLGVQYGGFGNGALGGGFQDIQNRQQGLRTWDLYKGVQFQIGLSW
jgi:hypothetical protein